MKSYQGELYRTCKNWFNDIPLGDYINRPINYLEVGVYYGGNVVSVCQVYARHPQSKVYAIDVWQDYDEYTEYKGKQQSIYEGFLNNIELAGCADKVVVKKGFSHTEIPKLEDDFFDIVYIDANHKPEYVLEDCVLAFRKLKVGGYMVLDDYGWVDAETGEDTSDGIDGFVLGYLNRIEFVNVVNTQVILRKVS